MALNIMTDSELMAQVSQDQRTPDGAQFGNWRYERPSLVLAYYHPDNGQWWYEVDLEWCNDAAQILDWILQVSGKPWASRKDVGDLVEALEAVVGRRLQILVCPHGHNKRVSMKEVLTK